MEFFTDRNLGSEIFPGLLQRAGVAVHRHTDHFRDDAPDAEWLPVVAARGWVVLSRDEAIMRNPLEREAVLTSGAVDPSVPAPCRPPERSV